MNHGEGPCGRVTWTASSPPPVAMWAHIQSAAMGRSYSNCAYNNQLLSLRSKSFLLAIMCSRLVKSSSVYTDLEQMQEQVSVSSEQVTPPSAAGSYTGRTPFQSGRPVTAMSDRLDSQQSLGMATFSTCAPSLRCFMSLAVLVLHLHCTS